MHGGVMVPLVTPLTAVDRVCAVSLERLIEAVRPFVTGLVPALSSGEGWRLGAEQWRDLVSLTRRFARGLPVLAGIEMPTARETIERARLARQLQVEAVVVPPPFNLDLPAAEQRREVLAFYRAVTEESGLPVFLYNEPKLTGTRLDLATLVELCRSGAVIGVKDSSGSPEITRGLLAAETGVPVFQGWEHLCLATTPGVAGYILPLANLEPALCQQMLHSPSPALQAEIGRHCVAHDLLGDEWYLGLKRELERRGLLSTARRVV